MNRYYTVMLIPEQEKRVISFRIPHLFFRAFSFMVVIFTIMILVLAYDYKQILNQVYENRHLGLENRKLRDQLNIFQMKINTLSNDIQRIKTFEKKLRVITGLEKLEPTQDNPSGAFSHPSIDQMNKKVEKAKDKDKDKDEEFVKLKNLHRKKIAEDFGLSSSYYYTKTWSDLTKRSFLLANSFASFDYEYQNLKNMIKGLEIDVHEIDTHLLDKESFLKSTPTILPTKGWITSFYGPRQSPYSGRLKMHEGLDIGAQIGTEILAPADGVVTYSGHKPGFGNFVQIDHGYGIETIFGHAKSLGVRNGQKVQRGDMVAKVGNTGLSTGPHVHYEVRVNGIAVDPFYFVLD